MNSRELRRIAYDQDALESFYRENIDGVLGFITRRVRDPQLAADLTAEVFLAAIEAAPSYRSARGEPRPWLFGIARTTVAAEFRRSSREGRARARIEGRRLLDEDDLERIAERADAESRSQELYAALELLPAGERAVIELAAVDGLSTSEAAASLGIRPVTARVRLYRARSTLRRRLIDDTPTAPRPDGGLNE
jgi:RNA polymerase sigma factor (sigma-70 family)